LDAPLDDRFGRASKFLIYDTSTSTFSLQDNEQPLNSAKGAGIKLAVQLVEENVDSVICRHIGSIAYETLSAAGIRVYICKAQSVRNAICQLVCGELVEAKGANVEAHRVSP